MKKNYLSTRIQMLDKLAYKFIKKYSNKEYNFRVGDVVIFKGNKNLYDLLKKNPKLRSMPKYSSIWEGLEGLVIAVNDDIITIVMGLPVLTDGSTSLTEKNESLESKKDISNITAMGHDASHLEIVSTPEVRERNIKRYSLSEEDNYIGELERKYPINYPDDSDK